MEIDTSKYTKYKVTGTLRDGRRFEPKIYSHPGWAFGINLWKGTVWGFNKKTRKWEVLSKTGY